MVPMRDDMKVVGYTLSSKMYVYLWHVSVSTDLALRGSSPLPVQQSTKEKYLIYLHKVQTFVVEAHIWMKGLLANDT